MKIAFLANHFLDPRRPSSWSGLPYFTRRALENAGVETRLIHCEDSHRLECWIRFLYWKFIHKKRYLRHCNKALLRSYGRQISTNLAKGPPVDAVFSVSTWLLAYLETELPTLLHTDACFAALLGFYESFSNIAPPSIREGHLVEQLALERCTRIAYSSHWAVRCAQENYDIDVAKMEVVHYGAGFHEPPNADEVENSINNRDMTRCNLLLVGVDWVRKGVDIAIHVAQILKSRGCAVRLTIVGCEPPVPRTLPEYVELVPFIDKGTAEGRRQLSELYKQSHFFILPSRAEATAVVFSEACAYGLPCLAPDVGGLSSIIINNVNGRLFSPNDDGQAYANYIFELSKNHSLYRTLAANTLNESVTRLSWKISGPRLAEILQEISQPMKRSAAIEKATAKA